MIVYDTYFDKAVISNECVNEKKCFAPSKQDPYIQISRMLEY